MGEKKPRGKKIPAKDKKTIKDLTPGERLLCELLSEGYSLAKACKESHVSANTFYRLRESEAWKAYQQKLEAYRKTKIIKKYDLQDKAGKYNTQKVFKPLLPLALAVLEEALEDVTLPMRLRLDAAKEVLDRTGLGKTQKVNVSKELTLPSSLKELATQIQRRIQKDSKGSDKALDAATVEGEVVQEAKNNKDLENND